MGASRGLPYFKGWASFEVPFSGQIYPYEFPGIPQKGYMKKHPQQTTHVTGEWEALGVHTRPSTNVPM